MYCINIHSCNMSCVRMYEHSVSVATIVLSEEDSVMAEYQEQMAELEAEEMEEEEEEEEEEEDQDARKRMKDVLIEQFDEENEAVASLKVLHVSF